MTYAQPSMRCALTLLLLTSCQGEQVSTTTTDAGSDASCAPIAGNLVRNASFEEGLIGWSAQTGVTPTPRKGGAAHCETWVEVSFPAAGSDSVNFLQDVSLTSLAKKGSTVHASAYLRDIASGETSDVFIIATIPGTTYKAEPALFPGDGSWKRVELEWVLPMDTAGLIISIGVRAASPRTIGIDQVAVSITP